MKIFRIFRLLSAFLALNSLTVVAFGQAAAPAPVAAGRSISVEVTVLRFKPVKAERLVQGFKGLGTDLKSVVDALKNDGEVSILYNATRDLRLEDKVETKFDALETRPIVIIGKPGAPLPPVTQLGVTLKVSTRPTDAERIGLSWDGSISWTPEMLTHWQGEKFLSFAGAAVSTLKTAGLIKGEESKSADIGLGLAQLFNPKGKPTENEIYELPVNKTIALSGSRNCKNADLIINATTAEMGSKEAQTILLILQPTLNP